MSSQNKIQTSSDLTSQDIEIIEDELKRYDDAFCQINQAIQQKLKQFSQDKELARDLTAQIVGTSREEEKQALQSDESVAHHLTKLRLAATQALSDLGEQPYFARVIYNEKGRDIEFKLGIASFPELRIIDWRKAPISKLYYDYEEGDDYDDEIAGVERQGHIKLKRAYRGKGAILGGIDLKDTSYIQSKGVWHKQLRHKKTIFSANDKELIRDLIKQQGPVDWQKASESNGYLKQILSLLTPEQFALISRQYDEPLVIQGAAGTGKTTVALHRLAWLLYEGNAPIHKENVLVMMFNQTLARYVKHILPDLGILGVKITTYSEWARDILETTLGGRFHFNEEAVPEALAKLKSQRDTKDIIKKYIPENVSQDHFSTETLFGIFSSVLQEMASLSADSRCHDYLHQQIKNRTYDIYDSAILLHILNLSVTLKSKQHPLHLEYLLLDEAQDFTPLELDIIISFLENKNHMTIAGDLGQKIIENRDFGTWQNILSFMGLPSSTVMSLQIGYRSTYQIYELSECIRNPLIKDEELLFTPKFGPEPLLTICGGYSDAVQEVKTWIENLTRASHQTTGAIVCRHPFQARELYSALVKLGTHGIRLGDALHFEFTPGIVITSAQHVKGLEFNAVLIFNPSPKNYDSQSVIDRNLLYVAVTRAEFQLDMITFDDVSDLVPDFINRYDLTAFRESDDSGPLFSGTDQDASLQDEEAKSKYNDNKSQARSSDDENDEEPFEFDDESDLNS